MTGGGPVTPMLPCVPIWMGLRSSWVSSWPRTMRGVSSITMSVVRTDWSLAEKRRPRIGTFIRPGMPFSVCRSCSRSSPASRFDSPSRSRRRVTTLRVPNVGSDCPATRSDGPSVLFSTSRSRMISFS